MVEARSVDGEFASTYFLATVVSDIQLLVRLELTDVKSVVAMPHFPSSAFFYLCLCDVVALHTNVKAIVSAVKMDLALGRTSSDSGRKSRDKTRSSRSGWHKGLLRILVGRSAVGQAGDAACL
jgi:hypothetical protein